MNLTFTSMYDSIFTFYFIIQIGKMDCSTLFLNNTIFFYKWIILIFICIHLMNDFWMLELLQAIGTVNNIEWIWTFKWNNLFLPIKINGTRAVLTEHASNTKPSQFCPYYWIIIYQFCCKYNYYFSENNLKWINKRELAHKYTLLNMCNIAFWVLRRIGYSISEWDLIEADVTAY